MFIKLDRNDECYVEDAIKVSLDECDVEYKDDLHNYINSFICSSEGFAESVEPLCYVSGEGVVYFLYTFPNSVNTYVTIFDDKVDVRTSLVSSEFAKGICDVIYNKCEISINVNVVDFE